jgi:hypothetical protein
LTGYHLGREEIVSVEELDVITARFVQGAIAGFCGTATLLGDDDDAVILLVAIEDLLALIRRGVVGNDDFDVVVSLGEPQRCGRECKWRPWDCS